MRGTLERKSSSPRPPSFLIHQRAQTQLETQSLEKCLKFMTRTESHYLPICLLQARLFSFLLKHHHPPALSPAPPGEMAPAPATPRALQPGLTLFLHVLTCLKLLQQGSWGSPVGQRPVAEGMLCSALCLLKEEMGLWLCSNASAKHLRRPEQWKSCLGHVGKLQVKQKSGL